MKKTLSFLHNGYNIRVENTWLSGARLYIDDKMVDETKAIIHMERDAPLLSAKLETETGHHNVTVFMDTISSLSIKILVQVDGQTIARID